VLVATDRLILDPLVRMPEKVTPSPRRLATVQRTELMWSTGATARLARADRGLDRLDLVDVDDGLLAVAADAAACIGLVAHRLEVRLR
jgi:hypothetical protein